MGRRACSSARIEQRPPEPCVGRSNRPRRTKEIEELGLRIEDFDRLEVGVQERILNHKSTILNVVVVSVAQLAERWTVAPEAVGSKPSAHPTTGLSVDDCRLGIGLFRSIRNPKSAICNWFSGAPVAQVDRAAGFEPAGREFNSLRARHARMTNEPMTNK